ncbi:hypothetical protein MMC25_006103 [Agyrium rufum]|nr:hypothetical protein [Agyrium rufum]
MATPYAVTDDGYEIQWQTNYLSAFFLTKLLLSTMTSTAATVNLHNRVRIVNLSSDAVFLDIAPYPNLADPKLSDLIGFMASWKRYCHSKIAIVLLTHHLHMLFTDQNLAIKVYSLNPGVIETNLQAADPTWIGTIVWFLVRWNLVPGRLSREDGARTTLACATSVEEDIINGSGAFFGPIGQRDKRGDALIESWQSVNMEEQLWMASEKMLTEKGFDFS